MAAAERMAVTVRELSGAPGGPMQTLSSASRTCIAAASTVECTATVRMPISWQARWMRSAISPRLAIRTLPNFIALARRDARSCAGSFDDQQRLAVFHRRPRLDQDAGDCARLRRLD